MRKILSFGLLLICITTSGQQSPTWQEAADKYLALVKGEDLMFEAPDARESLRQILIRNRQNGSLNASLMHLLTVWSAEAGDARAQEYFDATVKLYGNQNAYRLALLLSVYALSGSDKTKDEDLLNKGLLTLRTARKDSTLVGIYMLRDLADVQSASGKYSSSFQTLQQALRIAERKAGKQSQVYADLMMALSLNYAWIGNEEKAVQQKKVAEQIEADHLGVNQPYTYIFDREPLPSFSSNTKNRKAADHYRIATLFQYPVQHTYRRAIASELFGEVIVAIANQPSEELNYGAALVNKGVVDFDLNPANAAEAFRKAAPVYEKQIASSLNMKLVYYNVSNLLACSYWQLKDYNNAVKVYRDIEKFLERSSLGLYDWAKKIYHNIILSHHHAGDSDRTTALLSPYYRNDSYSSENDFTERYILYGNILFGYGEYKKALTVYDRARTEFWDAARRKQEQEDKPVDDQGNPITLISEGNAVLEVGPNETVSMIHEYKPFGDEYVRFLFKYAQAAFMTGNYTITRQATIDYINEFYTRIENDHINHERGTDLYEIYQLKEKLFPAYDLFHNIVMMDTTSDQDILADNRMRGYLYILDSKANVQYEYRHMLNAIENGSDTSLKKVLQEYIDKRNQLVKLKLSSPGKTEEIENLKITVDTLKSFMSKKTSYFNTPSEKFVYWTDVQRSLGRNEAAIEIRRFPKYDSGRFTHNAIYAAYVITPGSKYPQVTFLQNGNYLESRGLKLYQNSIKSLLEDNASYNAYWLPIQQLLPGMWKVYLSSDGCYSQINVNTLQNPDTKKYLIETLAVYNVVSTKTLRDIKDFSGSVKSATLMGRPAYYIDDPREQQQKNPFEEDPQRDITRAQIAAGDFADLPGTEKEIATIDKILKSKGVTTQYFIGKNSTEEVFKQSNSAILHIATHGFWFNENNAIETSDAMLNSGLVLAGVKNFATQKTMEGEDGILTAYEVQGLNLNKTELVVLSACETAAGHVEAGEGVYGLQRAFNIAGADKVIMSLWKVDDTATQELFTSFYKEWINTNPKTSEAFRHAQDVIRAKYRHPYYWGAFILVD
jgi:CHAT domain-containing protein